MGMLRVSLLVLAWTAIVAAAPPALETQTAGQLSVGLPKGWKVTTNAGATTVFVAQQDPAKPDAAAVLVTVQATGNKATEDQLLDAIAKQAAKDTKIAKRETVKGGGHLMVADGMLGTLKVRFAAIAIASGDSAIVGVFVAKPADFDAFGGSGLVVQILGSIKASAPAAETKPVAEPTPAKTSDRITIADLAGVWDNDSSSMKQYATSSGTYAGAAVVSMRKIYTVGANGEYSEKFSGYQGGTAAGGGSFSWQTYTGTWGFTPGGVLEITVKGAIPSYYTIVSFSTDGEVSKLVLAGPKYNKTDPPDTRGSLTTLYRHNAKKQ